MKWARVEPGKEGGVEFYSSFSRGVVNDLKAFIPQVARRPVYEGKKFKCWMIDPYYLDVLQDVVHDNLGIHLVVDSIVKQVHNSNETTELFRVEYLGSLKDRGTGENIAFGGVGLDDDLEWKVLFPEDVLRKWFEGSFSKPGDHQSFYSILTVKQDSTPQEIKKGWRTQLRRFHPDINKDPDADQMTIKINDAYNILRNPTKRKKYDVGLKLQSLMNQDPNNLFNPSAVRYWNPPIRCGNVMGKGVWELGRFRMNKILHWEDIRNERGQILVSSWNLDEKKLNRGWI